MAVVLALAAPSSGSAQTTYTWTGASGSSWSDPANWTPTSNAGPTIGSIVNFPPLNTSVCNTCYVSSNNFSPNAAQDAVQIDDGVGYHIGGNPLALGSGGLTANTGSNTVQSSFLNLPVALTAGQRWSIDGGGDAVGALDVNGGLSGDQPLSITLKNGGFLSIGNAGAEVGAVTVAGGVPADTGINAALNGTLFVVGAMNATTGNPINLTAGAHLTGANATVGPLRSSGGAISVGLNFSAGVPNTMAVNGSVALDSATEMVIPIIQPGTSAGADYSQLTASGAVDLGGATLGLLGPSSGCPALHPGDVDTLISAAGGITGTFAGVPDGALIPLVCSGPSGSPYVRINYTPTSVTATFVPFPPVNVSVPGINGVAQQGQPLTEQHGTWTNTPTGYSYQWLDCNPSGQACTPIPGATGQTYTLGPGDVSDTVRVAEYAANAGGQGGPAYSPATAVVLPLTVALPPGAPTVAAGASIATGTETANFTGIITPNGRATTVVFQYGLDSRYTGTGGPVVYDQQTPAQTVPADFTSHTVTAAVTGLLPNALYHVRMVASNTAGTVDGRDQTFTTHADAPPPPPVLGKSLNVKPVFGIVFVKPPAGKSLKGAPAASGVTKGKGFIPLTEARQLPAGTQIDSRKGSLQLTAASTRRRGKPHVGTFKGAIFKATQSRSGPDKGLTTLRLLEGAFPGAPSLASCGARAASDRARPSAQAAKKLNTKKILQTLRAKAKGPFRSTGRTAAATVRGTVWTTTDRCDGTLIAVQRDTVQVTNLLTRAVVLVHAGHSYFAKARTLKHDVRANTPELRAIEQSIDAATSGSRPSAARSASRAIAPTAAGWNPVNRFRPNVFGRVAQAAP
jgi:hypothetical protein